MKLWKSSTRREKFNDSFRIAWIWTNNEQNLIRRRCFFDSSIKNWMIDSLRLLCELQSYEKIEWCVRQNTNNREFVEFVVSRSSFFNEIFWVVVLRETIRWELVSNLNDSNWIEFSKRFWKSRIRLEKTMRFLILTSRIRKLVFHNLY